MQKLMGFDTIMKLLKGRTYVSAHLFHVDLLLMDENEILMSENLTLEEDIALVGFILGCSQRDHAHCFQSAICYTNF